MCGGIFASALGITPHSRSLRVDLLPAFKPWQGLANNLSRAFEAQQPQLLQSMVSLLPCNAMMWCEECGCTVVPTSHHSSSAKAPAGCCIAMSSIAWRWSCFNLRGQSQPRRRSIRSICCISMLSSHLASPACERALSLDALQLENKTLSG